LQTQRPKVYIHRISSKVHVFS